MAWRWNGSMYSDGELASVLRWQEADTRRTAVAFGVQVREASWKACHHEELRPRPANGSIANLRGQGPRAEARAARQLPRIPPDGNA